MTITKSLLISLGAMILISIAGAMVVGAGYATGHISVQQLPVAMTALISVTALLAMARSYQRFLRIPQKATDEVSMQVSRNLAGLKPIIYAGLIIMPLSLFSGLWMSRNDPIMLWPVMPNLGITWWLLGLLKRANFPFA